MCEALKCRNCGNELVPAEQMEEMALMLDVFEARIEAVFKCQRCRAEHVLKATRTCVDCTVIIPPRARRREPTGRNLRTPVQRVRR